MRKLLLFSFFTFFNLVAFTKPTFNIDAESYIVMELEHERIIQGKNIDKQMLTASISKILTTITAIENGNLEDYVVIDETSVNMPGSKVYFEVNDEIKLNDLLYGLMLRSGNDCAYLIAKHISGSREQFKDLLNITAKKIGMNNSTFENESGLDSDLKEYNYSTARDMAKLVSYANKNLTFKKIFGASSFKAETKNNKVYVWTHKHKLIGQEFITGGKTGFTKLAHRTLVTTAEKDGIEVVVVTFNASNDFRDHLHALNETLTNMENRVIIEKKALYEFKFFTGKIPVIDEDIKYPIFLYELDNVYYKCALVDDKPYIKVYLNDILIIYKEIRYLTE